MVPGLRIHSAQVIQQRQEAELNEQIRATRAEFIRKKSQHEKNVSRGVNIPQLNAQQRKNMKNGLSNLFKNELNPMIMRTMPDKGDWDGWLAFEGAYEESVHGLRECITQAIQRNPQQLYGEKRLNPMIQAARDQAAELLANTQTCQHRLRKPKDSLHGIVKNQDQESGP
jgi:hypothetical protein